MWSRHAARHTLVRERRQWPTNVHSVIDSAAGVATPCASDPAVTAVVTVRAYGATGELRLVFARVDEPGQRRKQRHHREHHETRDRSRDERRGYEHDADDRGRGPRVPVRSVGERHAGVFNVNRSPPRNLAVDGGWVTSGAADLNRRTRMSATRSEVMRWTRKAGSRGVRRGTRAPTDPDRPTRRNSSGSANRGSSPNERNLSGQRPRRSYGGGRPPPRLTVPTYRPNSRCGQSAQ